MDHFVEMYSIIRLNSFIPQTRKILKTQTFKNYYRYLSEKKNEIPDEYFDNEKEADKEFKEIATLLTTESGLHSITMKDAYEDPDSIINSQKLGLMIDKYQREEPEEASKTSLEIHKIVQEYNYFDQKLVNHLQPMISEGYMSPENFNFNQPREEPTEKEEQLLSKFNIIRPTQNLQKSGKCAGNLQRKGKSDKLNCALIDIEELNYLDILTLRNFITDDAEILGKTSTGLCSKCQRKVAKTIKRARNVGILPHIGEFAIEDIRPYHENNQFHDAIAGSVHTDSETLKYS